MNRHTSPSSDEISLVDLVVLLVKRWKLMLVTFLLVLLAAIAFLLLRPPSYTYTSVYAIADTLDGEGEIIGVEPAKAVLTKLNILILPRQIRAYLSEKGWENLPFDVEVRLLAETNLILLSSHVAQEYEADVQALHRQVVAALAKDQSSLVERKRAALERRLASIEDAMRAVGIVSGVLAEPANEIERELAALQEGGIEQLAVRSTKPEGADSNLLLALSFILALVIAIAGAFISHFIANVRHSLTQA